MKWFLIPVLALAAASCGTTENNDANNTTSANNTTANSTTSNNATTTNNTMTANNVANAGGFQATGTYDGEVLDFNCTTFEFSDGNAIVYTEVIDLWSIKCRSTSGTHQITVAIPAAMAGEERDTIAGEGDVSFGPIDGSNLGKFAGGPTAASITVDTVAPGAIKGSFSAAWAGDAMFPVGTCSGTFDVTKE